MRLKSGAESTKIRCHLSKKKESMDTIIKSTESMGSIIMDTKDMKDASTTEVTAASTIDAMESTHMKSGMKITADIRTGLMMTTTSLEKYSCVLSSLLQCSHAAAAALCAASSATTRLSCSTLVSTAQSLETSSKLPFRCTTSPARVTLLKATFALISLPSSRLCVTHACSSSISLLRASSSSLRCSWARSSGVCRHSSCTEPFFYHQRDQSLLLLNPRHEVHSPTPLTRTPPHLALPRLRSSLRQRIRASSLQIRRHGLTSDQHLPRRAPCSLRVGPRSKIL